MTISTDKNTHDFEKLEEETLGQLGQFVAPEPLPRQRKQALFSKIMANVEPSSDHREPEFLTVRADEGQWFEFLPHVEKKILFVDHQRHVESYLLRMCAGAELPKHPHAGSEYCLVLEGDIHFDDLELQAGDFHLAKPGSWHAKASTRGGALLYLESPV